MKTESTSRFVSLADLASELGSSRSAVRCWLDAGGVASYSFGAGKNSKVSYMRTDVEDWLAGQRDEDDGSDCEESDAEAVEASADGDQDDLDPDDEDDEDDQDPDDDDDEDDQDDQDLDDDDEEPDVGLDEEEDLDDLDDPEDDLVDDSCLNPTQGAW